MGKIIIIIFLFACSVSTLAQDKPDFSGTWVMDEARSKTGGIMREELSTTSLVINHRGPEITMASKLDLGGIGSTLESLYFTDGRGETNEARRQSIKFVTKWSGNKLIIKYSTTFSFTGAGGEPRKSKLNVTERWELSKDGQKLTRTVSRTFSEGLMPLSEYDLLGTA